MRQPLIEIGHKLQQALQRVAPEEQLKKDKVEKQLLSNNIVRRIEEETRQIRQRKEEIERRKEEQESKSIYLHAGISFGCCDHVGASRARECNTFARVL